MTVLTMEIYYTGPFSAAESVSVWGGGPGGGAKPQIVLKVRGGGQERKSHGNYK